MCFDCWPALKLKAQEEHLRRHQVAASIPMLLFMSWLQGYTEYLAEEDDTPVIIAKKVSQICSREY